MQKLIRLDGTHAIIRCGAETFAFMPFRYDPTDARCHAVMDDHTATKVRNAEPSAYMTESYEPAKPVKAVR